MFIIKSKGMDQKQLENLKHLLKEIKEDEMLVAFFNSESKAEEAVEYSKSKGFKGSRVSENGQQKISVYK